MNGTKLAVWSLLAGSSMVAGCAGSDSGSTATKNDNTTVAVATTETATTATLAIPAADSTPPTSAAPTTTAAATIPTTVPATTAPETISTLTPTDAAQADVVATLANFYTATDRCLEAPDACDLDPILAEYTQPDTQIAEYRQLELDHFRSKGWVVEESDAIERTVIEVSMPYPDRAYTRVCERDAAISVSYDDGVRTVESEAIGYIFREFHWKQLEGRWFITESSQATAISECNFTD